LFFYLLFYVMGGCSADRLIAAQPIETGLVVDSALVVRGSSSAPKPGF
jgi:hypothetical protein